MAHFAQLNSENVVTFVTYLPNEIITRNDEEIEGLGVEYLRNQFGQDTHWVQTSLHNNFRNCFAGIGYTYDEVEDKFWPPKPEGNPSWVWNDEEKVYRAPIPRPELDPADTRLPLWNEESQSWDLIDIVFSTENNPQ